MVKKIMIGVLCRVAVGRPDNPILPACVQSLKALAAGDRQARSGRDKL